MPRNLTRDEARAAVRRLGALKGWPYEQEAQDEYLRVALKYARDVAHLARTITEIVDTQDDCPRPSQLRDRLQPPAARPEQQTWAMRCEHGAVLGQPCGACPDGTAYLPRMTDAEREELDRELAAVFARRGLPQSVLTGRKP